MPLSEAVQRTRMGNGPNAMNLGEMKKRATDLKRSLGDLTLRSDVLAQFSVISTQLTMLQNAMRLELRHYAMHPDAATLAKISVDERVRVVPAMHSIRLEPAMEGEVAEALKAHDETVSADPSLRRRFEPAMLQEAIETHNVLCAEAADGFDLFRKEKIRPREIPDLLAAARAVAESAEGKALLAAAYTGEGLEID